MLERSVNNGDHLVVGTYFREQTYSRVERTEGSNIPDAKRRLLRRSCTYGAHLTSPTDMSGECDQQHGNSRRADSAPSPVLPPERSECGAKGAAKKVGQHINGVNPVVGVRIE